MTVDQLRSWMTQYQQADQWWLAFSSGTHPEPVTLGQVEQVLVQHPHETVSVLHVDQAKTGTTEWVVLSAAAAVAAAAVPVARPVGGRTAAAGRRTSAIGRRPGVAGRRTGALGPHGEELDPNAPELRGGLVRRNHYGGIGRLLYFINLCMLLLAVGFFMLLAFTMKEPWFLLGAAILQPVGALTLLWLRFKNIGWNPWFSLQVLVPLVGLVVGPPAIAFPEGFADTRKLDTAAIVILCLVGLLFVSMIVIAIMQPEWLQNPYKDLFEKKAG